MTSITTSYRVGRCVLSEWFQTPKLSKGCKLSAGALNLIFTDDNEVIRHIDACLAEVGIDGKMVPDMELNIPIDIMQEAADAYPDPIQRVFLQEVVDYLRRRGHV